MRTVRTVRQSLTAAALGALGLLAIQAPPAHAQSNAQTPATKTATTTAAPKVDPKAIAALEKMGAFLRDQRAMKIKGEVTTDEVLDSGQKIQHDGGVQLFVRRPDRLRADVASDVKTEQLYYDGKTFTIYQPKLGYFAAFPAPPTLAALAEVAENRYGLDLPLADLFYWGTDKSGLSAILAATLVGPAAIYGAPCDHYAFHQADIDWQIWIEKGARPLPRKLVVTTITERAQPEHIVLYTWELSPALDDSLFSFQPPPTAHRIDIETIGPPGIAPRQGRSSGAKGRNVP